MKLRTVCVKCGKTIIPEDAKDWTSSDRRKLMLNHLKEEHNIEWHKGIFSELFKYPDEPSKEKPKKPKTSKKKPKKELTKNQKKAVAKREAKAKEVQKTNGKKIMKKNGTFVIEPMKNFVPEGLTKEEFHNLLKDLKMSPEDFVMMPMVQKEGIVKAVKKELIPVTA